MPPGRNGLQPQLTLQYSTGSGNGPFGLGWAVSVPGVSRKTTSGIPRYDDALDTFLISGAEDLVPVPAAISATRYRPRTEGLFAHIDHYRESQNDYWQVASKDGFVSLYGTPRPANAAPGWEDPATVTDPRNASHVFAWRLTQTRNLFGNIIEYVYVRDAVRADGPHEWDQLYLSEIRYADYGDPNAPQFLAIVRFTYAARRDPFSQYRSGFEIRTLQRCTRIDVITNPGVETPVRTYHLTYLDERSALAAKLPPNGISLLSQIQVEGHDGATSEWMPPLEFGHTAFEPRRRKFIPVTGADLPPSSLADPAYELADLLGNGLPDILQMSGGSMRYWRNLGGGRFDLPRPMSEAPAGLQLADPGVQLLDADGDGRIDLLVTTPTISGYFPMAFDGLWDRRRFRRYQVAPSFNLEDPEVRLVDLNGDGVTDALRASSRFDCVFNDPESGWGETRRVARAALDVFPNVDFADPRVKWADLTGDGLQDIALVHSGSVEYWPNLGYGNWGRRVHMANSPRLPYGYDPRRILVGDVDGDGLADIVYVEDRRVTLWINQSGNGWGDPMVIEGTPPVADMDAVRLVDLLGVGTAGVLWSANVTALPRPRMYFLDFTGATKPYLINEMDNHIGALTRVAYASSTSFYLQDQQALATQWQTPLPFPVQVVARVEAIDQISGGKLTTEYSYHHGYWDGVEREFRGFGRVDHRDSETFPVYQADGLHGGLTFAPVPQSSFSPPTEMRTWFHLGPLGDEFGGWYEADFSAEFWSGDAQALARPGSMTAFLAGLPRGVERDALRALRGHILRSELYALDGAGLECRPYTVTEHLRGVREESPPGPNEGDRLHIFFPFDLSHRTTQWERGVEPMSSFVISGDYDAYGQLLGQVSAAVARGRDFTATAPAGTPYLATLSAATYAQRDDATVYCVNRLARSTTYELVNDGSTTVFALASQALGGVATTSVIAQSYVYFDGAAFQGLPLGQLGNFGAPARTETLVLTEEILNQAYRSGAVPLSPPEQPPYLAVNRATPWTADYPQDFINLLLPLAGYVYHSGGPTQEDAAGFFTTTSRQYRFPAGHRRDDARPRDGPARRHGARHHYGLRYSLSAAARHRHRPRQSAYVRRL